MSFRMINTKAQGNIFIKNPASSKNDEKNSEKEISIETKIQTGDPLNKKPLTQEELDLIDQNFEFRDERIKNFSQSANPLLNEYMKKLLEDEKPFKKETIIYDMNLRKWVLKDNDK